MVSHRSPEYVDLDVPADVRFLQLLRVSVATAAFDLDPTLEHLDDLRLAVDELAVSVIERARPGGRLDLRITLTDRHVRVEGTAPADGSGEPTLSDVGTMLLAALGCDHRLAREGSSLAFDLTMAVSS